MLYGYCNDRKFLWQYFAVAECRRAPELGLYETYGLLVVNAKSDGWTQAKIIHDISPDCGAVKKMAVLFTEHQLSPVHFFEAVEDMMP